MAPGAKVGCAAMVLGYFFQKQLLVSTFNILKNELIARGEKPKGGSKGKKGIYIQTGDGFGKTPQENFAELVDLKRVSSYFIEVARELNFSAARHPSRLKKKKSVSSDLAI